MVDEIRKIKYWIAKHDMPGFKKGEKYPFDASKYPEAFEPVYDRDLSDYQIMRLLQKLDDAEQEVAMWKRNYEELKATI